jgi:hypothetical protein
MTTVSPFFTWRRAMTDSDLPSTTKLVLFVVAEYANAMDDICWPALETIAEKATLSVRAVSKHLTIAEQHGWLTRWRSRRPDRRWAHAHYRLSIPDSVAKRQRDAIDFDLAAGSDEEMAGKPEPRSEDAQDLGISEPHASDPAEWSEPRASHADPGESKDAPDESSWHHVPTNNPVNGSTLTTSLSQTTVVNQGPSLQREKTGEEGVSLARWMHGRIVARLPDFELPSLDAWVRDIDSMIDIDGRSLSDIARLFGWADRDKFWAKVITSPVRLRRNWDEIRRRRNYAIASKRAATSSAPPVEDDRQCAHVESGCRCTHAATTVIGAGSSRRGYCRLHIGAYED